MVYIYIYERSIQLKIFHHIKTIMILKFAYIYCTKSYIQKKKVIIFLKENLRLDSYAVIAEHTIYIYNNISKISYPFIIILYFIYII